MSKHFYLLLIISVVLNILFSGIYMNVKWGNEISWTRKAAEEAEEVASIACSGHGRAFLDGVVVDAKNSTPVCECYACYTGSDCSLLSHPCVADVDSGNPIYLEPFWMKQKERSGVLISGWHRMGYAYPLEQKFMSLELEKYIRKVHELVGNAVTEGRHIIFGTGSTQLLNAAVHALSYSNSKPAMVVASIPYYTLYQEQTEFFQSRLYEFKGDTSSWLNKTDNTNSTIIEFVTSPNNPDGQLKDTILKGPRVKSIHDHVYYWPHYTAIINQANEDLMLFSMSKLSGHAGSRFGWALVKDKIVHQKMMNYVAYSTMGVSHDTQLRALEILKVIVEGQGQELFEYGHKILQGRWERLKSVLSLSSRFSLQDIPPQFCSFYQRVREPSPAYAWLRCEKERDEDCYEVLKAAGILGRSGKVFGAGGRYVRLSLLKSQDDFDLLVQKLLNLVYDDTFGNNSKILMNA